jgi:hydroxypyruvate isomerase
MSKTQSRRSALQKMITGAAALSLNPSLTFANDMKKQDYKITTLKGNIRQSVCRWCFSGMPLDELCIAAKSLGLVAIDLCGPDDWETLKKYGLESSMCNGAEINLVDGFCEPKNHDQLIKNYQEMLPKVAAEGYKNLICFSGNRRGMDDKVGMKNCADGLKKLIPMAEKVGVTLVMELLNSKVDHKDYMCDRTSWGVELCKMVGSDNFKLLYDIYHMQIDEGDVIRTIKDSHRYIAHYHTAGVPGRHEIDETQELNYPAIMKAILDTGYTGYVAQEFIPTWKNPISALAHSIITCDV